MNRKIMASRHQSGENIAVITQLAWSTIFCVAQKIDLHRSAFCVAQPFHNVHSNSFTLYTNQCKLAVHFLYAHGSINIYED